MYVCKREMLFMGSVEAVLETTDEHALWSFQL